MLVNMISIPLDQQNKIKRPIYIDFDKKTKNLKSFLDDLNLKSL